MVKKLLNSNVVSAARWLSGFASVLPISARNAIELHGRQNLSLVKEVENVL